MLCGATVCAFRARRGTTGTLLALTMSWNGRSSKLTLYAYVLYLCRSSLDGVKCYLCPLGATCEQLDSVGTPVGVSAPIRAAGYYLWGSRDSYLSAGCSSPSTWELGDPCRNVSEQNMTYRIQKCSKLENFDKYWSRKRIFACLSGKEYYPCDVSAFVSSFMRLLAPWR